MSFHQGALAPFDTESSGTDLDNDRIVSATVARITPGQAAVVRSHLIAVDVDIPAEATEVHGITTEHARANGKPPAEVLDAVAADLADAMRDGVPVVGSNLAFDFTLLDRELRRHGLPTVEDRLGGPIAPVLDVYVIDKHVDRYRKGSRKLVDLCAHYGARIDGAHDAEFDAMAAARVLYRIGQRATMPAEQLAALYADRRYPRELVRAFHSLAGMSTAGLHEAQVGWYAEQAEGLAQWWRRKANELEHQAETTDDEAEQATLLADVEKYRRDADGICTGWPIRPWQRADEVPS